MPKFKSKPKIVDAEQFNPPHQIPRGVINVYQMTWGYTGEVWTIQGEKVRVHEGEWIVQEPEDPSRFYPVKDSYFKSNYEPVETFSNTHV